MYACMQIVGLCFTSTMNSVPDITASDSFVDSLNFMLTISYTTISRNQYLQVKTIK